MLDEGKDKKCTKCGIVKGLECYYRKASSGDGRQSACRPCASVYSKSFRLQNVSKIKSSKKAYYEANKAEIADRAKIFREANKDILCARSKVYRESNKTEIAARKKVYYESNKTKINARTGVYQRKHRARINRWWRGYSSSRRKTDIQYKLSLDLRNRLSQAVRNDQKMGSAVSDLGCSIADFKKHLESQFKVGMSWDNQGEEEWHIDHILPISKFDLTKREELLLACHYTNMRPMWAKGNLKKKDSLVEKPHPGWIPELYVFWLKLKWEQENPVPGEG